MTHEILSNLNEPEVFFTSLTLRFKNPSLRHRLLWNTENLIPEKGEGRVQFSRGHVIVFTREFLRDKKFMATHLFAIKKIGPEELATAILGVHPGAKLLLQVTGVTKIKRNIQFFETLQQKRVDLRTIPECVWTGIHSRNEANMSLSFMAEWVIYEQRIFTPYHAGMFADWLVVSDTTPKVHS